MTDANGAVVRRADYRPFGEEQSIDPQTTENDMKFVGKEKDKETGLYYFGARYMRPEIGRFVTTDPVGPVDPRTSKTNYAMLANPQRLNRYAYSLISAIRDSALFPFISLIVNLSIQSLGQGGFL
ncbi:MAG: RHS repeat-associated core domain-containing protein [Nitrospirae bacterium]|nr:RHS repeat-associated core domain-containing protein [Nitrospirota bacterium]